jgi:hypothetical protein
MTGHVRFYSHACIALEGERETLLMDPWLFGDVFNDAWTLHAPPDLDAMDFSRVRHIWISHDHPDHLHFPSLRSIRERVDGPVTAYYRRHKDPAVRDALRGLGFESVELTPHEETAIAADISMTLFPTGIDSALAARLGDRVIVSQNDCRLSEEETERLKRAFPRIDAWFFQFSLGGYYANADDPKGLQAARERHLKRVEHYYNALRPAIFVPFASFFYFSKEANAFLNEWSITPAEVIDALPHLPVQILWSGDALLWEQWEARNAVNLARWTKVLRGQLTIKPHAKIPESDIVAAGRAFVREVVARGLGSDISGETHLEIKETGRAAAIDWEKGAFTIFDRADRRKLAATVPGEELLYFFKSPHGGGLFYASCFHVVNKQRWQELLRLRNEVGRADPSRISVLKRYVAKLDRKYFGGITRACYRRIRAVRGQPRQK